MANILQNKKAKVKLLVGILGVLILISIMGFVLAARTINFVKLDGGSSVTVEADDSISISVRVTTDGSDDDWKSTGYQIGSASIECENTGDHNSDGTYTESFNINAPVSAGTYDFKVWVYSDNGCSVGQVGPTTLANAITVSNTPPAMNSISDSPDPVLSGSQITIIATNERDDNSDTLQMVCSYSSNGLFLFS